MMGDPLMGPPILSGGEVNAFPFIHECSYCWIMSERLRGEDFQELYDGVRRAGSASGSTDLLAAYI